MPEGIPGLTSEFYYSLLITSALNITAWTLYVKAISLSEISLVMPYVTLTPLFMAISGLFLLGEWPTNAGFIGIGLIAISGFALQYVNNCPGKINRGIILMVLVALIWSVTGSLEKIVVRNS